jgi:sugar O-acyltransferase (sialic acid O-acetyltransferase NeuD family)
MKKPLIIFGTGQIAQLAYYYFSTDTDLRVVAFTVDAGYRDKEEFCGLPVIEFDNLINLYPPDDFDLFVAISYAKLNLVRKEKTAAAKGYGYKLASYVSSRATIFNNVEIGENCFILENNVIQPFAVVGSSVTLWSGNHIGHHSTIGDHTFIASHVVISGNVKIGKQCFIGVNATLRDDIRIGDRCVIGAGVLMLEDANAEGVYSALTSERSRVPSSRLRRI